MRITLFGWKTCSNRFDTREVRIEGECKYSFARFPSPNHFIRQILARERIALALVKSK